KQVKADAAVHTGDFVGKRHDGIGGDHKTLEDKLIAIHKASEQTPEMQTVQGILQKHKIEQLQSLDQIPEEDRTKFEEAFQKHSKRMQQVVLSSIVQSYNEQKPHLERLRDATKQKRLLGVIGNHDYTPAYKLLDSVEFVELENAATLKGKTGTKFRIQGTPNTLEFPRINQAFASQLAPYFINYTEGKIANQIDDPQEMEVFDRTKEEAKQRLGDMGCDIFMNHKPAGTYMGSGEITEEYMQKCGMSIGGHAHGGLIYNHNGKPCFITGTNHIFVYDLGKDKKLDNVRVYRIREAVNDVANDNANDNAVRRAA
ncbi:MAG: hypothetical protein ACE5DM_04985, partial [Candidatus Nanoarchaeia archaeon]